MFAVAAGPLGVVPRFCHWWLSEIAGLAPARLRRQFRATGKRIVLLPDEESAAIYFESGEQITLLGCVDPRSPSAADELHGALLRQALGRGVAVSLRIPATRALRTEIELPFAAEANLDEVVSFELDRHTPFRADQVFVAPRIIERHTSVQRLRIELLIVPRKTVEELIDVARKLEIVPDRIDIANPSDARAASGDLLRGSLSAGGGRGDKIAPYAAGALAAVLAIAVVLAPVVRAVEAKNVLAAQLAEARNVARQKAALEKEIDALRQSELFLVNKKLAAPTVSELLWQTTQLLPDTTWLEDWQVSGNEVQLGGVSQSASSLVGLLEQSDSFSHTTFLSPVTRDSGGEEHFHIATTVKPRNRS